jgi:hypothetical protein
MQYTERRRTDNAMFKSKKGKPQTMTLQNDTQTTGHFGFLAPKDF